MPSRAGSPESRRDYDNSGLPGTHRDLLKRISRPPRLKRENRASGALSGSVAIGAGEVLGLLGTAVFHEAVG